MRRLGVLVFCVVGLLVSSCGAARETVTSVREERSAPTEATSPAAPETTAGANSDRTELVDLFADWASELFRDSAFPDPDGITDVDAECMGERLVESLVGVESVEDIDKVELHERLQSAQRGLDYETNSAMYSCLHDEWVDVFAGEASNGFAGFHFYQGFRVPTVTADEAECIGEYMVDTIQSDAEYLDYLDADELSFVANLALLSCLDMKPQFAMELTQAWAISKEEAECVTEATFEQYPVDKLAAKLDRDEVVAVAIAAGCVSEGQLVEEP